MRDGNSGMNAYHNKAEDSALVAFVLRFVLSLSADKISSLFYRQLVWVVAIKRYFNGVRGVHGRPPKYRHRAIITKRT